MEFSSKEGKNTITPRGQFFPNPFNRSPTLHPFFLENDRNPNFHYLPKPNILQNTKYSANYKILGTKTKQTYFIFLLEISYVKLPCSTGYIWTYI